MSYRCWETIGSDISHRQLKLNLQSKKKCDGVDQLWTSLSTRLVFKLIKSSWEFLSTESAQLQGEELRRGLAQSHVWMLVSWLGLIFWSNPWKDLLSGDHHKAAQCFWSGWKQKLMRLRVVASQMLLCEQGYNKDRGEKGFSCVKKQDRQKRV